MALARSRVVEHVSASVPGHDDTSVRKAVRRRPALSIPYTQVQLSADRLIAAVDREDDAEARRVLGEYIALVLKYADHHLETTRGFFLSTLGLLLTRINRKAPMPPGAREELTEDLVHGLESATSVDVLVAAFSDASDWVSAVGKAVEGPKLMRLETALNHVRRHYTGRLRLLDVARKSGFSVPAFVKIFKERTGTSFLPFVRTLRIEHAKNLLATTDMTVHAVALASGFQSPITMTRSFRTVTGHVPTSFRRVPFSRGGKGAAGASTAARRSSSSS